MLFGGTSSNDGAIKLAKLRNDPEGAARDHDFVVEGSADYDGRTEGGPCTVECRAEGGVYKLRPVGGAGSDYYFPYVSQTLNGGVGQCAVPVGVPNGTIVLTGAMAGCSLDVARSGSNLMFRHDGNAKSMAKLNANDPRSTGQQQCRVDPRVYMLDAYEDNLTRAAAVAHTSGSGTTAGAQPEHYLISVKTKGGWVVVHSAVMGITIASRSETSKTYERIPQITNTVIKF